MSVNWKGLHTDTFEQNKCHSTIHLPRRSGRDLKRSKIYRIDTLSKPDLKKIIKPLKVSKFQKHFFFKLHCPKIEQNIKQNSALWSYLGQNFVKYFIHFLGNRVSKINAFEIYWPLQKHLQEAWCFDSFESFKSLF